MFVELMNWLKDPGPEVDVPDDLRLAVAVLLVEAAHMDDKFGPHERAVIERLLLEKFDLRTKRHSNCYRFRSRPLTCRSALPLHANLFRPIGP